MRVTFSNQDVLEDKFYDKVVTLLYSHSIPFLGSTHTPTLLIGCLCWVNSREVIKDSKLSNFANSQCNREGLHILARNLFVVRVLGATYQLKLELSSDKYF